MKLTVDARRFPRVKLGDLRVGLLPTTFAELDFVLGAPSGLAWYDDLVAAHPRGSWRDAGAGAFVGGVRAEEAAQFAAWAEPGGRLLSGEEWRQLDRDLDRPADRAEMAKLAAHPRLHPAARALVRASLQTAKTWCDVARLNGGLLEWVSGPAGPGLLGRPPADRIALVMDPQRHDPARPLSGERHPAFGFRTAAPDGGQA